MLPRRKIFQEEHEIFRESVRRFFAREMLPNLKSWDEAGIVDKGFWKKAGAAGLLCPDVPEEYGGPGGDFRYNAVIDEEMGYAGTAAPGFAVHSDSCDQYILEYGSDDLKKEWLPRMVSGEIIGAIAMTEPGTGSDLQAVKATAIRDGNHYVLNGQKTFITNGQNADLIIVVAKTNPEEGAHGVSLILVESNREGFARGRNLKKIGQKGSDTSELFFSDVRVPLTNCLGEENQGFIYLMQQCPQERLELAIGAVASSQKAFDITGDYVKERRAFGRPIFGFQNTRFKLAEMKADLAVGWAYVDQCLEQHLEKKLDVEGAAIAKLWLTEMQGRIVDQCLQLHGGYGYMEEYPISKMFVDARVQRIYGGTSEIMKELIAKFI